MTNPPDIEKLVEAIRLRRRGGSGWYDYGFDSGLRAAIAVIRALTPPEDQVTSETERSMLSGQSLGAGADHAPCPAASNGSVADAWLIREIKGKKARILPGRMFLSEETAAAAALRLTSPHRLCLHFPVAALSTTLPERDEVVEALRYARPLIEAIAAWESKNGTLAAILPHECEGFCKRIAYAARTGSARAALSRLKPSREGGEG